MRDDGRAALMPIAWGLLIAQVAGLPIVWVYFFAVAVVFTTLVTVLSAIGCVLQSRRGVAPTAASALEAALSNTTNPQGGCTALIAPLLTVTRDH